MNALRFIFSVSLAVLSVSTFVSAQGAIPGAGTRDDRYRIGYQDVLDVTVFKHSELNTRVSINPDGTIILPRATKPIDAYCKTERELKAIIEEDYRSFLKNPYVNVVVAEQRSQSFGVMGAVEKPGNFFVSRRIPLLELLSFAGGPNKEAGSRLLVARLGSSAACRLSMDAVATPEQFALMNFKIRDVQEGKRNMVMQPGDVVSVLEADSIFVYGNVNKQGEVKVKEPRTLRQIIASAEGFAPSSQKDKIRVFRQKPDSLDWEEAVYNIKEIEKGKIADPFLMPGDIVAVSEDKFAAIVKKVTDGVTGGFSNLPILIR
ncbi:MAG: polysaccharide biosynthesis/export family protein [Acidobacteria bacterium]|nr:polysaccharide biosynthesis/export family protein [Acidobacteriota bacterium]